MDSDHIFQQTAEQAIPSLNIVATRYCHQVTGAEHIHLAAPASENVFLVALRTIPNNSRGVAHILEHTVLCGSQRYPVRDPFFMMTRRSLNTFMNALTANDWTAYPFASENGKDFDNLLQVYLDAVFFPRLDELDFAQEGHRLEFSSPQDASSPLVYKGVVYNEMKGAMSAPLSVLWQSLNERLYPTTTYRYNSGGDPACIPELDYAALVDFHRQYYHPSNAIFMTYGNRSAAEHQRQFEQLVLSRFTHPAQSFSVPHEQRYTEPQHFTAPYACPKDNADNVEDRRAYMTMAWLLGQCDDHAACLNARLLSDVLLQHSASPLRHALEKCSFAGSPSALCGLEDSQREWAFMCGVENSDPQHSDDFQSLVLDTLQHIVYQGIDQSDIDATLNKIELQQREITGDGMPYGLQMLLRLLPFAVHNGNVMQALDWDSALADLRHRCQNKNFIPQLIDDLLLRNTHRVCLTLLPDDSLAAEQQKLIDEQLASIKAEMSAEQQRVIIEKSQLLARRQQNTEGADILPKVTLADVGTGRTEPQCEKVSADLSHYKVGTNGLVYHDIVIQLPQFNNDELPLLSLYAAVLTELGVGDDDYLAIQKKQAAIGGDLDATLSVRSEPDDVKKTRGYMALSAKSLARAHDEVYQFMEHTLSSVRFDEQVRMRELVSQIRNNMDHAITSQGHKLAVNAAMQHANPIAHLRYHWSGLASIQYMRELDDSMQGDEKAIQGTLNKLQRIHQAMVQMARCEVVIADRGASSDHSPPQVPSALPTLNLSVPSPDQPTIQHWQVNTQVNFCAGVWHTVSLAHPDSATLSVLGNLMQHGYLHRTIREQGGAYGSGAKQNGGCACFSCFSYRDPRHKETLADFQHGIEWVLHTKHTDEAMEQAILGVIAAMDKPASPAGEASAHYYNHLHGWQWEQRNQYRQQVLQTTTSDIRRVGERYLRTAPSMVVISSDATPTADIFTIPAKTFRLL